MAKSISIRDLMVQANNISDISTKTENVDPEACFQMGMVHLLGINKPIDFNKASTFFDNQSLADDPDACRLLGYMAECEGNYSQAFRYYANAVKGNRPFMNKVSEARGSVKSYFKKLELPEPLLNNIISNILNEYIKGGEGKVEASIKLALICNDGETCLNAAQTLFDKGDYFSAMRWLRYGNVPEKNSLYALTKEKISESKKLINIPNVLEVFEVDGNSLLDNFNLTSSYYTSIKSICDEKSAVCKKEWIDSVVRKMGLIKKMVDDEEAARKKKQEEEAAALLLKQREEKAARLRELYAQQQEEKKQKEKKKFLRVFDIILIIALCLTFFLSFLLFLGGLEKNGFMPSLIASFIIYVIIGILPFFITRWIGRKIINNRFK